MDVQQLEKFASAIVSGLEPGAAYASAGFPGPYGRKAVESAELLLQNPEVKAKIEEMRAVLSAPLTKKAILDELWNTYLQAKFSGNYPAANRALELLGKEKGMFADTRNIRVSRSLADMSDEELKALVEGTDE